MFVNPDETVAVTRAVTKAVLPGFTTPGTVCWCIKRKHVSNQQVRMMLANFLWPWKVLELDIPEIDQEPEAENVSRICKRYNQRTSVEYPLLWQGGLEISRKSNGASDHERCREGVDDTSSETSVPEPEKGDRLRARQPNPIAKISGGVSSLVGRVCTRRIQRVTSHPYLPHHFKVYSVCPTVWPRSLHTTRLCHACH